MNSNLCRICLAKSSDLCSIFEQKIHFKLPQFFEEFCNIQILDTDKSTTKMCTSCVEKLKEAYELRSTCIESDRLLRLMDLDKISKESSQLQIAHKVVIEKSKLNSEEKLLRKENSQNYELLNPSIDFPEHEKIHAHVEIVQNKIEVSKAESAFRKNSTKSHMCTVCGKTFFTSGHLRSHELTHKSSKDFTCNHCEKKFLMKSYLNRHMKSHLNERSYKCDVCQKGFNTSTTLGYHFRLVHSGDTTFQCTYCSKGFPLKIQLVSHTRTHTGEKPHKCDQCDKKYSHKIDLKRHTMLHSGLKAYKCPYCEKTFTKRSNMECHIPTHTRERPFKCNICSKDFRQPCPYKKHMQTHSDAPKTDLKESEN